MTEIIMDHGLAHRREAAVSCRFGPLIVSKVVKSS